MPRPFSNRQLAREAGRKGAAKRLTARGVPAPFAGTILDAMDAAGLTGPTWDPWRSFWKAVYALPMDEADRERLTRHTGRSTPPAAPVREGWLIVGRRGVKSRVAAVVALYQAIRCDYRQILAPGERAVVPVIAADRLQARSTLAQLPGGVA